MKSPRLVEKMGEKLTILPLIQLLVEPQGNTCTLNTICAHRDTQGKEQAYNRSNIVEAPHSLQGKRPDMFIRYKSTFIVMAFVQPCGLLVQTYNTSESHDGLQPF